MRQSIRRLFGALGASLILLAGVWGFALVDLSTEYYMPASFEAMLGIDSIDQSGLGFTLLGEQYQIAAAPFETLARVLEPWRLFLPAGPQWAALLTQKAYRLIEKGLTQQEKSTGQALSFRDTNIVPAHHIRKANWNGRDRLTLNEKI